MKVIFVSSGNSDIYWVSPIIQAQAESIRKTGIEIDLYRVLGKGLFGYLSNIIPLAKSLKKNEASIIHAHYSLCSIVALFSAIISRRRKETSLVCSLMGSDVKGGKLWQALIRFLTVYGWDATIVKSKDMKQCLGLENPIVIPNGVNTQVFKSLSSFDCKQQLDWEIGCKHILFGADPQRPVKNYALAQKAYPLITTDNCEFHILGSIPHADIPIYLNACDVLLLTSKWEGSPNIIKEAMACGTPVVCTDVGDVRWLLDGVDGTYICSHDPVDIARKLDLALKHIGKTNGRDRLIELGLDADSISNRIVGLYEEVLKKKLGN